MGDQSNLILDPDLDSYYLMEALVVRLPHLTEAMGQARSLLTAQAVQPTEATYARFQLTSLATLVGTSQEAMTRNFDVAFRETHDVSLESRLEPALRASIAAISHFLDTIRLEPGSALPPDEYWKISTAALDATYALYDAASPTLDRLFAVRIAGFARRRTLVLLGTLPSVLLVVYLFAGFYLTVMRTVSSLERASARMVSGDMDDAAPVVESTDELGQVTRAFSALAGRLRSEYVALQESEERTRLIVESAHDAFIAMDAEGRITDWNRQAEVIFGWTRAEALGAAWPRPSSRPATATRTARAGGASSPPARAASSTAGRDHGPAPRRPRVPGRADHLADPLGATSLFSAFIRDITERKQARGGAAAGQGGGRGGQPGQERVPGQHEPRDPHADERHHRHDRAGPRHRR